jgi:hypothetical protein
MTAQRKAAINIRPIKISLDISASKGHRLKFGQRESSVMRPS